MSSRPSKRTPDDADLLEAQPRPSKRKGTFRVATLQSEHRDRRTPEGAVFNSLGELRLSTPPIEALPQELLLQVFEHLVHHSLITAGFPEQKASHCGDDFDLKDDRPDENGYVSAVSRRDLRNLCLVSRKFKMAATTLLYRCAQLATIKSPWNFLLTLKAHPELQPLVKHITVPTYRWRVAKRLSYAYYHDTNGVTGLRWHMLPDPGEDFYAQCGEYLSPDRLKLTLSLLPNLRTLVIPQTVLQDGPFSQVLVLRNLTKLRINLMAQNEVIFHICDRSIAVSTLTWLSPDFIGHRFPALQRLEISTPNGRWEADLISEEADAAVGGSLGKYVESLKTATTHPTIPAEWDLMSLKMHIFHPSKFRTLEFAGPGKDCNRRFEMATIGNWDLNRFFAEKGGGLRTLSLDWEVRNRSAHHGPNNRDPDTEEVHFGPERRLTTLDKLTNLTHLTVSLQALFGRADIFWNRVDDMEASPDSELAKLLPPSLRTLRISEYIPDVFEDTWNLTIQHVEEDDYMSDRIHRHNEYVFRFLQVLRNFWLLRAEDRELWLRRQMPLDLLEDEDDETDMGRARIHCIMDYMVEEDGAYELVRRPPKDVVWGPE